MHVLYVMYTVDKLRTMKFPAHLIYPLDKAASDLEQVVYVCKMTY